MRNILIWIFRVLPVAALLAVWLKLFITALQLIERR